MREGLTSWMEASVCAAPSLPLASVPLPPLTFSCVGRVLAHQNRPAALWPTFPSTTQFLRHRCPIRRQPLCDLRPQRKRATGLDSQVTAAMPSPRSTTAGAQAHLLLGRPFHHQLGGVGVHAGAHACACSSQEL
jgi:hypothetical protein